MIYRELGTTWSSRSLRHVLLAWRSSGGLMGAQLHARQLCHEWRDVIERYLREAATDSVRG